MDIKMPVTSDVLEETVYIYAPLLLLDNMQKLPGSQGFLEVVQCDQAETHHQYSAPSSPPPTPT